MGLDAQRKAIEDYLNGGHWSLLGEYVEVESGKIDARPELQKALQHCKMTGATLIIAKLDRLSRDSYFIGSVQKSGIEFICCDMPYANKFTIDILAAVAEYEGKMISTRIKAALAAAKARGRVLGNPKNLNEAAAKGRKLGLQFRKNKAYEFALKVSGVIDELSCKGMSLNRIAQELNKREILTARGKIGSWTPTAVKNVRERLETVTPVRTRAFVQTGK